MKNADHWRPSKFIMANGKLIASRDPDLVSVASRLNTDLLADKIFMNIVRFAKGRLLDLGCGRVPLFEAYRSHVTEVVCVDWSNSGHGLEHVDVAADLNLPLPLSSASFDTVILTDVLEHINDPETLLKEIARVLTPYGVVIGSVPFMYRLHEEPYDYFRYTHHALERYAANNNFVIESIECYGFGTDVLMDVLGKLLLSSHWRYGASMASVCQTLGHRLRDSAVGRLLNRSASNMPLGYSFVFRLKAS